VGAPLNLPSVPALVLCGGRGTRLESEQEKPLVPVCGEPMFDRVVRALRASAVSTVHAVPSPATPGTRAHAVDRGIPVVDAPGEGYVADLRHALDTVAPPVVTVVADLPHLAPAHVDRALATAAGREAEPVGGVDAAVASLTICVPVDLKRALDASVDTWFEHEGRAVAPTGLNVVGGAEAESADDAGGATDEGTENVWVVDDERLAVNVNRPRDREVAESLCD
jgi:adenosylcobinamide-phosphate guanylyltransferase